MTLGLLTKKQNKMSELKKMLGWLEQRVPTSESAKPYLEFALKEYAQIYHKEQLMKVCNCESWYNSKNKLSIKICNNCKIKDKKNQKR